MASNLFAQTNADWLTDESPALLSRKYPPMWQEDRQVVIPLADGVKVILGVQHNDDLLRFRNVDSLLTLFRNDFAEVDDTLRASSGSFNARYRLQNGTRDLRFWPYKASFTQIRFGEDENLLVKSSQDTIVIEQLFTETQPLSAADARRNLKSRSKQVPVAHTGRFRIYLFINSVEDLKTIAEEKLNPKVEQVIEAMRSGAKGDLFGRNVWAFRAQYTGSSTPVSLKTNKAVKPDHLLIVPRLGMGITGNRLVPNVGVNLLYLPQIVHRAGRTRESGNSDGFLLSWDRHFTFSHTNDGSLAVQANDFVSVGMGWFKNNSDHHTNSNPFNIQRAEFKIGYLARRRGELFQPNTFRISTAFSPYISTKGLQRLRLEPELYFNGFFKSAYPGLRLTIGF